MGLNDSSIAMLGLDRSDQSWVSVLLNYRRAELNPSGNKVMLVGVEHTENGDSLVEQ